ncbi:MAG: group II intron reverse transcriptase domain-containing protein [Paludibacteraceae bacterium]|nr:group II intron reverse transcriptase domain-containing protein [Paludibacteraceae bacterium]
MVAQTIRNIAKGGNCDNLYDLVHSEDLLYTAYDNISHKSRIKAMGVDNMSLDNMTLERLECLRESLQSGKYFPSPSKRIYIAKKNGGARPLGIPCTDDKIVQEEIRILLDAIYDHTFDKHSHGYRTGMSVITALSDIERNFNGIEWFIEGDIKGCFENIDHDILLEILIRQIKDNQFISLIDKFLKAGHIERGMYFPSKRGTPQGGIISPVLANIYLNELDRYIEELTNNNNEGMLKYIRYADDFLIGVNGTKEDCENLKKSIAGFISEKLRLELSQEKTLITPSTEKIRFIGYDIWRNPENDKLEMTVPEEISKAMRRGIRMTQKCKPFVTTRIMAERLQNGVCEICGRKEILIMRQIISRKTLSQSGKLHKMTNENCDMNIAICPKCNYSMDLR